MKIHKRVPAVILFICVSFLSVSAQPGAGRVKEELHNLLDELGMAAPLSEPQSNPVTEFINSIITVLIKVITYIFRAGSYLVIPLIVLLVFLAGFFGLRFFSRFRKEKDSVTGLYPWEPVPGQGEMKDTFSFYTARAEKFALNGEFGEAIVQLHKASIVFLRIKKILLAGEYHTNNEIRKDLRHHHTYYEAFSGLAGIAERKAFRSEVVSSDLYGKYYELFTDTFRL